MGFVRGLAVHPPGAGDASANEKAIALRVNHGLPQWLVGTFLKSGGSGRRTIALLFYPLVPFLKVVLALIQRLPYRFKNVVVMFAWRLWLALHRKLPPRVVCRGISDELSIEAQAMHNFIWWGRMIPNPLFSIRFALSQLSVMYPPDDSCAEWIDSAYTPGLRSAYLRLSPESSTPRRVLCWAFAGAFVSGDVDGNRGHAEHYGRLLGCDVFIVDMRLCPEHTVQDAVLDFYRGYEWLLQWVPPENIIMFGLSSGAGTVLRMLQLAGSDEAARHEYFGNRSPVPPALPQPAGAILLGAFVEYTKETESMKNHLEIDWVVSQSVWECVYPMKDTLCGSPDKLAICSPLHQSTKGLCPLLMSVSEHECLFDEDVAFAAKARDEGVDVTLSTQPFMCHVYQVLSPFLPEAAKEEAEICKWVKGRGGAWA